jgi:hypothetical protein
MKETLEERHRWENNIEMDFKEIGWVRVDSIHLTEGRGGLLLTW